MSLIAKKRLTAIFIVIALCCCTTVLVPQKSFAAAGFTDLSDLYNKAMDAFGPSMTNVRHKFGNPVKIVSMKVDPDAITSEADKIWLYDGLKFSFYKSGKEHVLLSAEVSRQGMNLPCGINIGMDRQSIEKIVKLHGSPDKGGFTLYNQGGGGALLVRYKNGKASTLRYEYYE